MEITDRSAVDDGNIADHLKVFRREVFAFSDPENNTISIPGHGCPLHGPRIFVRFYIAPQQVFQKPHIFSCFK